MTRKDLESWNIRQQAARHFQSLPVLRICCFAMSAWHIGFYDFTGSSVDSIEMELNQQSLKTTTVYKIHRESFKGVESYEQTTSNIFQHI